MTALTIGFLVFPKVRQAGPDRALRSVRFHPGADVGLIWKDLDPIVSATGLVLIPDTRLAEAPRLDVLCVPGGVGVNALMEDEAVLAFLRRQSEGAPLRGLRLHRGAGAGRRRAAGGRRATTHWASHDFLARLGVIPEQARVVSTAGSSAGAG